jgi:hypothetical protein
MEITKERKEILFFSVRKARKAEQIHLERTADVDLPPVSQRYFWIINHRECSQDSELAS